MISGDIIGNKYLRKFKFNVVFFYTIQAAVVTESFQEDDEQTITDSTCQSHIIGKTSIKLGIDVQIIFFLRVIEAPVQQRIKCAQCTK